MSATAGRPSYGCYHVKNKGRMGSLTVMPSALIFTFQASAGKEKSWRWSWTAIQKHLVKTTVSSSSKNERHLLKLMLHNAEEPPVIFETASREELEKIRSDIAAAKRQVVVSTQREGQEDPAARKVAAMTSSVRSDDGPKRETKTTPRRLKSLSDNNNNRAGGVKQPDAVREASQQLDRYKRKTPIPLESKSSRQKRKPNSADQRPADGVASIPPPNAAVLQASQQLDRFKRDASEKNPEKASPPKPLPSSNAPKGPQPKGSLEKKRPNAKIPPTATSASKTHPEHQKKPAASNYSSSESKPNASIRQASRQLDQYKQEATVAHANNKQMEPGIRSQSSNDPIPKPTQQAARVPSSPRKQPATNNPAADNKAQNLSSNAHQSQPNAAIRQASQQLNQFKREATVTHSNNNQKKKKAGLGQHSSNDPTPKPTRKQAARAPSSSRKQPATNNPATDNVQTQDSSANPQHSQPNAAIRQASHQLNQFKREANVPDSKTKMNTPSGGLKRQSSNDPPPRPTQQASRVPSSPTDNPADDNIESQAPLHHSQPNASIRQASQRLNQFKRNDGPRKLRVPQHRHASMPPQPHEPHRLAQNEIIIATGARQESHHGNDMTELSRQKSSLSHQSSSSKTSRKMRKLPVRVVSDVASKPSKENPKDEDDEMERRRSSGSSKVVRELVKQHQIPIRDDADHGLPGTVLAQSMSAPMERQRQAPAPSSLRPHQSESGTTTRATRRPQTIRGDEPLNQPERPQQVREQSSSNDAPDATSAASASNPLAAGNAPPPTRRNNRRMRPLATPGAVAIEGTNGRRISDSSHSVDTRSARNSEATLDRTVLIEAELVEGSREFTGDIVEAHLLQEREMRCQDAWKSRRMRAGFVGLLCIMFLIILGIVLGFTLSRDDSNTAGDADQTPLPTSLSSVSPVTTSPTPPVAQLPASPNPTSPTNPSAQLPASTNPTIRSPAPTASPQIAAPPSIDIPPTSAPSYSWLIGDTQYPSLYDGSQLSGTQRPTSSPTFVPGASDGGGSAAGDTCDFACTLAMSLGGPLPSSTQKALKVPNSPQSRARDWLLQDPSYEWYEDWKIIQRYALATFFYATGGEGWGRNGFWLEYELDECEWYGDDVSSTCQDGFGGYTQLSLMDNGLSGTFPPEFFWLTGMMYLDLSRNDGLEGALPSEIGLMSALSELLLDSTYINGQLPSELGGLQLLRSLRFQEGKLLGTIPSELGLLTALSELVISMSYDLSSPIPTEIGLLSNSLTILDLSQNNLRLTVPTELGRLTRLDSLSLNSNYQLGGTIPSELGELTRLHLLDIQGLDLHGSLPAEVCALSPPTQILYDLGHSFC